jgi:hypothetical protein
MKSNQFKISQSNGAISFSFLCASLKQKQSEFVFFIRSILSDKFAHFFNHVFEYEYVIFNKDKIFLFNINKKIFIQACL